MTDTNHTEECWCASKPGVEHNSSHVSSFRDTNRTDSVEADK